jgi:hypothetical protein
MRKSLASLIVVTLALTAAFIPSFLSRHTTGVVAAQTTGVVMPKTSIYALNADNTIFVMAPGATSFTRLVRVTSTNGNLIGIDFRVADGLLYALTDTGSIYTINLSSTNLGAATLVSNISPRFAGGYQSLMDFNPVLNAVRLIGSNCQNYAVVNSNGGNLNATAVQTSLAYAPGDVNAGVVPNISAGSYTNNYVGAANTLFYAIDYDLDTFVTIQPATPGGSSATGGGQLQTLGKLVTPGGAPVNVSPTADLDIYTDANNVNYIVGVSGRTLFTIDLSQINQAQALGSTQNVVVQGITMPDVGGGFVDIAVAPASATPAPTPTPTPTPTPKPTPTPTPKPTPTPTVIQAETGVQGGGNKVATDHAGFTGTGFVDFADGAAGGNTTVNVTQTGAKTVTFRYANATASNRPCAITLNGATVGTLAFGSTGAWETWKTVSITVNFGTGTGSKALKITSTTAAGGPNLDALSIQ